MQYPQRIPAKLELTVTYSLYSEEGLIPSHGEFRSTLTIFGLLRGSVASSITELPIPPVDGFRIPETGVHGPEDVNFSYLPIKEQRVRAIVFSVNPSECAEMSTQYTSSSIIGTPCSGSASGSSIDDNAKV